MERATALVHACWARHPRFSPDGRVLYVTSNLNGVAQRWAVEFDQGGWPRPCTFLPDGIDHAALCPHSEGAPLIVTHDPTGTGRTQLYVSTGRQPLGRLLAPGHPLATHFFQGWSRDGTAFYFAANRRRPDRFDLYRQPLDGEAPRRVWTNDAPGYLGRVEEAPDGQRLLVLRVTDNVALTLTEVDLAAGTARTLLPDGPATRYLAPAYAPDGRSVYLVTDRDAERHYLARLDLDADTLTPILHPDEGEAEALALSDDGRHLAYVVNVDGYSRLYLRTLETGATRAAPLDPQSGVIGSLTVAPDGSRLAFTLTPPERPSDVLLWDFDVDACRPVTQAARANESRGARPELTRYASFDGRRIPAFLYRPPAADEHPVPAVVYLHGGPEAQFRPAFDPLVQLLVARGLAVLAPNVRGSTGYGKAYHHLDDGSLRHDALRDVAHAARWLRDRDDIDGNRLAVCGASYGGYLTLAALAQHPDLWAAGVSIAGISSLVTLLQRMTPAARRYRETEYGRLDEDYDALLDLSPLTHARHITAPTLLIHGERDVKVPIDEARQMAALLRARDVPVDTLFFDDEGHAFSRPANKVRAWATAADFLRKHLSETTAEPPSRDDALPLSRSELTEMAARAATLDERLGGAVDLALPASGASIDARWRAWCEAAANGDPERFARRLEWDDLDESATRRLLGTPAWPEGRPLPGWVETVSAALARFERDDGPPPEPSGAPEQPFEELAAPFVAVARDRWALAAGAAQHLLEPAARAGLERALMDTLGDLARPTLTMKWKLAVRRHRATSFDGAATPATEPALHRRFLAEMRAGGFAEMLHSYPVLARLLGTAVDLWVEAQVEFVRRLAEDADALQRHFRPGAPLGTVAEVQPQLSDRHEGGRGVVACTFASGLKLIYKPRTVGLEVVYNGLLRWVNAQSELLPLKPLDVLDRTTHGWVEYAAFAPCLDETAVARYYRRTGQLLGLLYGFHGTDCHWENIVACGEQPVVVDAEMLAVPSLREPSPKRPHVRLKEAVRTETLLEAGFLPEWRRAPGGALYDMSALLAHHPAYRPGTGSGAGPAFRVSRAPRARHLPLLHGQPVDAHDYADEITAGFDASYRFLERHRDALAAPGGPLDALARQQVRVIFRDTSVYTRVLATAIAPRHLRDGMAHAVHLEQLARGYRTPGGTCPFNWAMLAAERQALARLDVPYFTTGADQPDLTLPTGATIPACFTAPSLARVRRRLAALGETDRVRQTYILRGSLGAHRLGFVSLAPEPAAVPEPYQSRTDFIESDFVEEALRIARELMDEAIPLHGDVRVWLVADRLRPAPSYQFGPASYGLAQGQAGIAFFLGAVAHVSGDKDSRVAAYEALAPVREALGSPEVDLAEAVGLGASAGLGGIVYALTRLSHFLDDLALQTEALHAAHLVTPERIADDTTLDLLGGSAGALLGLVALYEASGDEDVLERARACGRHLVEARREAPSGQRVWETVTPGRLLTGMSHGAAGIAYALLRLYEHTGDDHIFDAAREAIAYERAVYDAATGNWPDFRADVQPSFWTTWCHGAPGIGLARLGGLSAWKDEAVRHEIETAVATTLACDDASFDHLCCGAFGRLELPAEAARLLGRPELLAVARRRAAARMRYACRTGGYRLRLQEHGCPAPSLFYGMAGIGYQLLRLAHPDRLPSVLCLG